MIRLLMPHFLIFRRTPRLRPPAWRLLVLPGVGVVGLFLGLDDLDPCLGNELTGRLLAIPESQVVEIPHLLGIADPQSSLRCSNRHGRGVVVVHRPSVPSAPLARTKTDMIVIAERLAPLSTPLERILRKARAISEAANVIIVERTCSCFAVEA